MKNTTDEEFMAFLELCRTETALWPAWVRRNAEYLFEETLGANEMAVRKFATKGINKTKRRNKPCHSNIN